MHVGGTAMDDKPIAIIKELFALHGALLRDDPDRLGQLLPLFGKGQKRVGQEK